MEYNRSDGPGFHNAITAYQAGATGAGVTVGVIDSGIDPNSHEFAGRIHAQSSDVTGAGRALGDDDGHGTEVSRVIAAAKDDRDTHGIAYNATILSLRADQSGSCTTPAAGEDEASCSFFDSSIAAGINRATDNGARVINISLGGPGGANAALRSAINRATLAGIVIVVSAGNEGNNSVPEFDPNNPSPFAQALVASGNGLVIISTSVDDQNLISDFSNKAGVSQNTTLSALGEGICCEYQNDTINRIQQNGQTFVRVFNGTSFSAPQISGAAALLAQAFPNLTGQQIVNLLLTSARDAGAAGTDAIYGRGILDIARAFAPAGTTSLAGTSTFVPLNGNGGSTSGPMGDVALSNRPISAVILDSYGRAYDIDLAHGLNAATPKLRLTPALVDQGRSVNLGVGTTQIAFSISAASTGAANILPLALSDGQQRQARVLAGRVSAAISRDMRFSLGIRQAASAQVAALQDMNSGAFLTATEARLDGGFERQPGSSAALRRQIGAFGLTGSVETGDARLFERTGSEFDRAGTHKYPYATLGLSVDRQVGPAKLALSANWMREDETILGSRFAQFIGQNGARTLFVDGNGELALGTGWSLGASWRQGWTYANSGAAILGQSQLGSNAFSFDIARINAFASGDRLALRVAQPLRVSNGGLALNVPISYDYATLTPTFGTRRFSLAPTGREIASEIAWTVPITGGYFSSNVFWRQEPGHFENLSDDVGVAFRLQYDF
ncbi:peptidase S8 [Sphingorhabdus sp. IMCC26285]|uniref:Peptidase S8 n=1 Tax=Sphingorhabdus profundilacus TaxID=2509718 RepID=A0A6I4M3Z3_9SPHN|nr:S8 family peptidase [Sphingorhabdus profundilacus]MVZ98610.1 peptidase S8 [Sphingorhabdus profundilacus]